jgi:hypothetical protein
MSAAVEVKLLNAQIVERALLRAPAELVAEARDEMRGRSGIAVDIKKEIAGTFEASNLAGQKRGEKWLYSSRGAQAEQELWHDIDGRTLDTLRARILGSRKAEIHEFGGTISPVVGEKVAVPIADALTSSGAVKREFLGGPGRIGLTKKGGAWTPSKTGAGTIEVIPTASGTYITRIREGDDRSDREWLFKLEDEVEIAGGSLNFRSVVSRVEGRVVRRLDKAAGRALRRVERRS